MNSSNQIGWIILKAVDFLKTGVNKNALFLKGSKSKIVVPDLHLENGYGALYWMNISEIEFYIKQLVDKGFITESKSTYFEFTYPLLILTEEGKIAIPKKAEIELVKPERKDLVLIGESELETLNLLNQNLPIKEIGLIRNLKETTIYSHLYRLIVHEKVSAEKYISKEVIEKVIVARNKFKTYPKLGEIKVLLPDVSYDEIRCVLASKRD